MFQLSAKVQSAPCSLTELGGDLGRPLKTLHYKFQGARKGLKKKFGGCLISSFLTSATIFKLPYFSLEEIF